VVVAFSNSDFSLKYQDFFRLADATLPKSADYVDFKRTVDDLLRERFSLGFYVSRIVSAAGTQGEDRPRLEREAAEAIKTKKTGRLRKFLLDKVSDKDNIEIAVTLAKIAIEVADSWQK
jgi:hypothetical protein